MNVEDIKSLKEKKIVKWGEGWVVFITPEAKKLGWKKNDTVKVIQTKNKIIIKK